MGAFYINKKDENYLEYKYVGILALLTCTNITCSGTYAVLKLVVNCCLEVRGCSESD